MASTITLETGGTLRQWSHLTIKAIWDTSPSPLSEVAATYENYRFDVKFTQGGTTIWVPGFFDNSDSPADSAGTGNAGKVWRCRFTPPTEGTWNWEASFLKGTGCAQHETVAEAITEGAVVADATIDGATGSLTIDDPLTTSDALGGDLRAKGKIKRVGKYLVESQTGKIFLLGGPGSPENFLGYNGFSATIKNGGGTLHDYDGHGSAVPADAADHDWVVSGVTKGGSILSAINYLNTEKANGLYIVLITAAKVAGDSEVYGDGNDVVPFVGYDASDVGAYSCSKLAQWNRVFEYAEKKGIFLHLFFFEKENDILPGFLGGSINDLQRRVYIREMIARFGHLNGVIWCPGEETNLGSTELNAHVDYIRAVDPYDHPIAVHTFPVPQTRLQKYESVKNNDNVDFCSLQQGKDGGATPAKNEGFYRVRDFLKLRTDLGKTWGILHTETGGASGGNTASMRPDSIDPSHAGPRQEYMWLGLMSGASGNLWYSGYDNTGATDLTLEDFKLWTQFWDQQRFARTFFGEHLLADMVPDNELVQTNASIAGATTILKDTNRVRFCLKKAGERYIVYSKTGLGTTGVDLDLSAVSSGVTFDVLWFKPNSGVSYSSTVPTVIGGAVRNIGVPQGIGGGGDWAAVVKAQASAPDTYIVKYLTNAAAPTGSTRTGGAELDGASIDKNTVSTLYIYLDAPTALDVQWRSIVPVSGGTQTVRNELTAPFDYVTQTGGDPVEGYATSAMLPGGYKLGVVARADGLGQVFDDFDVNFTITSSTTGYYGQVDVPMGTTVTTPVTNYVTMKTYAGTDVVFEAFTMAGNAGVPNISGGAVGMGVNDPSSSTDNNGQIEGTDAAGEYGVLDFGRDSKDIDFDIRSLSSTERVAYELLDVDDTVLASGIVTQASGTLQDATNSVYRFGPYGTGGGIRKLKLQAKSTTGGGTTFFIWQQTRFNPLAV